MSTKPNIRLRTEIAAKVLPELIRYYAEANGKLPDSEVKTDLYREALSYADGLMGEARSSTTPLDTKSTASRPLTTQAIYQLQNLCELPNDFTALPNLQVNPPLDISTLSLEQVKNCFNQIKTLGDQFSQCNHRPFQLLDWLR